MKRPKSFIQTIRTFFTIYAVVGDLRWLVSQFNQQQLINLTISQRNKALIGNTGSYMIRTGCIESRHTIVVYLHLFRAKFVYLLLFVKIECLNLSVKQVLTQRITSRSLPEW